MPGLADAVLEASADGIVVLDGSGSVIRCNPAAEVLLGRPASELVGRPFSPGQARPGLSGYPEVEIVRPDGTTRAAELRRSRTVLGTDTVEVVSLRDITGQSESERTLRSLSAALQAADNAVLITDPQGIVAWSNRAFFAITGLSQGEVLGQSLGALARELGQGEAFEGVIRNRLGQGLTWQGRLSGRRRDGQLFHEERTVTPVIDRTGSVRHFVSVSQDITGRTAAEEQERRLLEIIDATPDFVGIATADGQISFINRAGRQMLGLGTDDDISSLLIGDCHPPEVFEMIRMSGLPAAVRDGSWASESALVARDGRQIPIWQVILAHRDASGSVTFLSTVGQDLTAWKRTEAALRERVKEIRTLYRVTRELSRSDLPLAERLAVLPPLLTEGWQHPELTTACIRWKDRTFDSEGFRTTEWMLAAAIRSGEQVVGEIQVALTECPKSPLGAEGPFLAEESQLLDAVARAIGEAIERERLQVEIAHAQRMETIGRLAGGVAHDFNNLLAVIQGLAELVSESLPPDMPQRDDLAQIRKAASRGGTLTAQLLSFSRKQVLLERVLHLGEVANELGPMLRRLVPERIELALSTEEEAGPVRADAARLEQVLLNLVVNAVDAIEGRGNITVRSGIRDLSEEEAARFPWEVRPGSYAHLTVDDDGSGMPPEVAGQIFEPFFTTKPEGLGTGLGLSMAFGFIKQSGGHILVDTTPGTGTVIQILLPIHEGEEVGRLRDEGSSRAHPEAPSGETVLLVEDDPSVRNVLSRMLIRDGHQVLEAVDGREALDILEDRRNEIGLVLSDVVMPRVGGAELAEKLVALEPRIPFVLMSGYDEEEITQRIREEAAAFLFKPFSLHEVREALLKALG